MTLTLTTLLDERRLHMDEVMGWAAEIAAALAKLCEQGGANGAVSPSHVLIDGTSAHLAPVVNPQATSDLREFAAVLRLMLENAPVQSEAERAQWKVLDRIAATNAGAESSIGMKKVAAALRLLRSTRSRKATVMPKAPQAVPTPSRHILAKNIQVGAMLASAATVAVIGFVLAPKFFH